MHLDLQSDASRDRICCTINLGTNPLKILEYFRHHIYRCRAQVVNWHRFVGSLKAIEPTESASEFIIEGPTNCPLHLLMMEHLMIYFNDYHHVE